MQKQFGHYVKHLFRHAELVCSATPHPCAFAWDCPVGTSSCGPASLKGPESSSGRRTCFGRSMIEMLGVLALVGILSIGGVAMYRRAVNNHHANTILDDVNRFAFVITEKGSFPIGEDIPKGDFKESGIYQLKGHQAYAGQYSITASNVPKSICEILIDKGIVDYKVGVVTAGGSVENEILYDTLNTDICTHDLNDVAFYFGDVSGVCNTDENEDTACTQNSDCCGGDFCLFEHPVSNADKGDGKCTSINGNRRTLVVNGVPSIWSYSPNGMTWESAQNFCKAQGLIPATVKSIGCLGVNQYSTPCESDILKAMKNQWNWNHAMFWLEYLRYYQPYEAHLSVYVNKDLILGNRRWEDKQSLALCHQ